MSFKTPYICDRRVYDKRGYWKNPNQDGETTCFYFIKEPPTMVATYKNGLQELAEEMTIVVFGSFPFCENDEFYCLGRKYLIKEIMPNYVEHNVYVKDMLKDRIGSIQLVLE